MNLKKVFIDKFLQKKIPVLIILFLLIFGGIGASAIQFKSNSDNKIDNNDSADKYLLSNSGSSGTKRALLVGVSDYPGNVNDLRYCDDDAEDMDELLRQNKWKNEDITLLTDSDAKKNAIMNGLTNLASEEDESDTTLFMFSGHGTRGVFSESICPYDDYISDKELRDKINEFEGKVIVILDTCYSGGMDKQSNLSAELNESDMSEFIYNFAYNLSNTILNSKDNRVILTACSKNELSYEIGNLGHGLFSYYVLKGLGWKSDSYPADEYGNKDDIVTAKETFNYAKDKVLEYANNHNLKKQTPQLFKYDKNKVFEIIGESDDNGPTDPNEIVLDITIHRIKIIDGARADIDGGADFSYEITVFDGNEEISDIIDYSNNLIPPESDHTEDVTSQFTVFTDKTITPEIKIKVWDKDPVIPYINGGDDLLDISKKPGDGVQDYTFDHSCCIYSKEFDFDTDLCNGDEWITSSGGEDGSVNEFEAKIWFKVEAPVISNPGGPYFGIPNKEVELSGSEVIYSGCEPYTYYWDLNNDGTFEKTGKSVSNQWDEDDTGEHLIGFKVEDGNGDSDIAYTTVTIYENEDTPEPIIVNAPDGKPRNSYSFEFKATDGDSDKGDMVQFLIDWDRNDEDEPSDSDWTDFYNPGETVTINHTYGSRGTYTFAVKARDLAGHESSWVTEEVSMPKTNQPLQCFLRYILYRLFDQFK